MTITELVTPSGIDTHPVVHRHTAGQDPAPTTAGTATTDDARALSQVLFTRLASLEEGTADYSYVRNTLVELNMPLVRFAARRFRARTESADDVIQVGAIGLIKAINRYEVARGLAFNTFALPTINGEIKRHFRDTSWDVHVPRRLQELRGELAAAAEELEQDLGRPPSTDELAVRLGRTPQAVAEGLAAANAYTAASLDSRLADEDPDSALTERLGYEDEDLVKVEERQMLQPVLAELPARDRRILAMRFGAEMTQSEIGAELGLSQMHVSRLLARILNRLRTRLRVRPGR
ncbi:SigB/SigF/SigG family RNA polymerase sigma factor [Streptomyces sp. A7024]|uniref:SigB/SigF/SigG family RNA polymerase sigma factor n=1 Tax=Streptomyces coryli TaxID=1128680 RepID=A0A6G4U0J8_9ACTN|nr:SigB/SigF/SigG family RNA polymerase sigma factor [Streptomyces coryli]NGN64761.1 SigB/SigF/SigG family RNA polymerase sigma factor [Streptomyces coryli]